MKDYMSISKLGFRLVIGCALISAAVNLQAAEKIRARTGITDDPVGEIVETTIDSLPEITGQPVGAIVDAGSDYMFQVYALGTGPFHYEWR